MKALSFNHPEELLRLWPDLRPDRGQSLRSSRLPPWWAAPGPKRGRGHNVGSGYGKVVSHGPRSQRVLVKAMPTPNRTPGAWYKHGLYLQREGAHTPGEIGRGFDAEQAQVDLKTLLAQWQRAGDPHFFKLILSPEHSAQLDLPDYTRRVMDRLEQDLGTPLQWAAIDHHNTGHAHVHVVLRGVSDGRPLTIARMYLQGGIKGRAQDIATRLLGPRSRQEMARATEHAIRRQGWSALDQQLLAKMDTARVVQAASLSASELVRLEHLEARGLAWRDGSVWQMSSQWEAKRMDERNITRKPRHVEQERDTPKPEEQQREQTERDADEQHRRAVLIDELEQDIEWGR